jgi:low affinity Fe/Cu permease
MDSIGVLGLTGIVVFIILFTWILYNGELYSRKRGVYTTSCGITCFVVIILGNILAAFSIVLSSYSMVEQVVYWSSVLILTLYLGFLIQDMRKSLEVYRITHDRESSIETEAN